MGPNGLLHQIFYVFNRIISYWVCSGKVFDMTDTIKKRPYLAFDAWVMEAYEEMWEEQGEEQEEPTEDAV